MGKENAISNKTHTIKQLSRIEINQILTLKQKMYDCKRELFVVSGW